MVKKKKIKLISWNVNGIRATIKKDFFKSFKQMDADIFAIQETKIQDVQLTDEMKNISGYEAFWSQATVKKGYSGVCTYTRIKPKSINCSIGIPEFDNEGRIVEMDFDDFIFFNVYFPNGQMSEERLKYKLDFYEGFFDYADAFKKQGRSLIISGDYNTAHNEIDLKNPKTNKKTSGFLRIERDWLDRIVKNGYVDTFRYFYPDTVKYSWWTYRFKARERNIGWRIDYFFVTEDIIDKGWIKEAFIDNDIFGSTIAPLAWLWKFEPHILKIEVAMKCKKNMYSEEEKKCLSCGAGQNHLRLLNPKGEEKGGVVNYSFRCGKCKAYFKEYWINGKLRMTGGA